MRQVRVRGRVDERVMAVIAVHYSELHESCRVLWTARQSLEDYDDVFQDCVLYVAQDREAFAMDEERILERFRFRFRMLDYQNFKDWQEMRQVSYADNIQTRKEEESL